MVKPEDPGIPLGESQAERDALNKVKLNKFGVVPAKVAPYAAFSGGGNFTLKTGGSTVIHADECRIAIALSFPSSGNVRLQGNSSRRLRK
jgi:hypothetical protein